ncbi:S24 family peptidase [Photobacterium leiognathi]|uniref:S24 family peptidase n=1 Tax=Photobacterium leiognathi TaxID=553611 RepID=UPI002981F129|nr:S24 family peptidase [Photobacterium leiognathi]
MPFAPPTHGYEENPIGETVYDYLLPNNCSKAIYSPTSLELCGIVKNDVIIIDPSLPIKNGSIALIRLEDETFVVKLVQNKGKWFAVSDTRKGSLSDDITMLGVVTNVIKNQID